MSESPKTFTAESITRINKVIKICDSLALPGNTENLKRRGVESILFFGSPVRGEANKKSDIDICVIHNGEVDFGPDFGELDYIKQSGRQLRYGGQIAQIIKGQEPIEVVLDGLMYIRLKKGKGGDMQDVIHLFVVGKDSEDYDSESGMPYVVSKRGHEGIEIWSNRGESDGKNLLLELIGLK